MTKNGKNVFFFLFLLIILSFGCTTTQSLFEKTSIEIVEPIDNFRLTDTQVAEGTPSTTPLSVKLDTNREEMIKARVILDDSKPVDCYLIPNQITPCGQLPLYQMGQHTIVVEVDRLDGKIITDKTVVTWEEMTGFDTFFLMTANILGSQNPTLGFLAVVILATIILASVVGIKSHSFTGFLTVVITSIIGVIFVYAYISPSTGAAMMGSLLALISSSFVVGVIAYAVNKNYSVSVGSSYEIHTYDEYGRPVKLINKGGLLNVSPHTTYLQPPPVSYRGQPQSNYNTLPQQGHPPQIAPGANYYLPPVDITEQEKPKRGLARLLSAFLKMNRKDKHEIVPKNWR